MRRPVLLLALLVAALTVPAGPAAAAAAYHDCPSKPGFDCMTVWVPLDRTGVDPGRIPLRVERLRASEGPFRGIFILLAGGPGQQGIFDAGDGEYEEFLQDIAPGWDVVSYDQRGTGRSGVLRCEGLEDGVLPPPYGQDAFADAAERGRLCAADLGAAAAHHATADSVADLESIREAIGATRLALGGVSYGTVVAQAYAAAHPDRVSRLILDSVVDPEANDGFGLDTLDAVPRVLTALCRTPECKRITRDLPADVRRLDARLATAALTGSTVDAKGDVSAAAFGGPSRPTQLLDLIVTGDLEPAKRALLPGAVEAALAGDADPLLRLVRPSPQDRWEPAELSIGLFAATSCLDARLPWTQGMDFAARVAAADAAAAAVPDVRLAGFNRGVLNRNELIGICAAWPYGPRAQTYGPLPDVPTLILNGRDDTRTTIAEAQRVAARLPRSTVILVPNQGHSVIGSARCANTAVRRFMTGRPVGTLCRQFGEAVFVPEVPPRSVAATPRAPGLGGTAGRVLQAVRLTVGDIESAFALATQFTRRDGIVLTGLRRGTGTLDVDDDLNLLVRLRRYTYVPGVELSGGVAFGDESVTADVRIGGAPSVRGRLRLEDRVWTGTIGGRRISWAVR